jgi:hypothetical protein
LAAVHDNGLVPLKGDRYKAETSSMFYLYRMWMVAAAVCNLLLASWRCSHLFTMSASEDYDDTYDDVKVEEYSLNANSS